MELLSKRSTFATWKFLTDKSEFGHPEFATELKRTSDLLQQKEYTSAGNNFLIMWQDVQTKQQNLYSMSTFVSWDLDMVTSNNGASMWIKELEELGISLIRDAAMAFFLAVDEPYDKKNIRRHIERENKLESSPWPKLGSAVKFNGEPFEKGTGIDLVLEDMKHPLDILLDSCTTNRETADMLSYYYFIRSAAHDIRGYYSADMECIVGQSSRLSKEEQLEMLKHALQSATENSDMGHKEWIKACINKLINS